MLYPNRIVAAQLRKDWYFRRRRSFCHNCGLERGFAVACAFYRAGVRSNSAVRREMPSAWRTSAMGWVALKLVSQSGQVSYISNSGPACYKLDVKTIQSRAHANITTSISGGIVPVVLLFYKDVVSDFPSSPRRFAIISLPADCLDRRYIMVLCLSYHRHMVSATTISRKFG